MNNRKTNLRRDPLRRLTLSAAVACFASHASPGWAQAAGSDDKPARRYANPVLHADYSDPDVIRVGDDYYLTASSFFLSPGLPILHSRDLVHWRIIANALPRLDFAPEYDLTGPLGANDSDARPSRQGTRYGGGVWAPSLRFHEGRFYLYWATPGEGIFMATATDPAGPWSAPVTVYAGKGYEDPCPFWDDNGDAWLVHGKVGAGPLILHRMSNDGTRLLDDGFVVAEDRQRLPVLEGPKFHKRNGWYYIFAPIGGVGKGPQAVGRARKITGPYEWRDVLLPSPTVKGPHQGGYVETQGGEGWFIHFNRENGFGRILYLEPVRWENDWPIMGDAPPGAIAGQPVTEHAAPRTGDWTPQIHIQQSDEFSDRSLGLQWSWNHNPVVANWSLTSRPGWMRLTAAPSQHLVTARNTLTQILIGPSSSITARVDVRRMADGQRGGLSLFGIRPSWVGVVQSEGRRHVTFADGGAEQRGPALTSHTLQLRAQVDAEALVRYSYSLDEGRSFVPIGKAVALQPSSWWKGSRPALFTYQTQDTSGARPGRLDVDWVRANAPAAK